MEARLLRVNTVFGAEGVAREYARSRDTRLHELVERYFPAAIRYLQHTTRALRADIRARIETLPLVDEGDVSDWDA